jgi:hypothetical protein
VSIMRLERRTFLILLLVAGFVIRFGTVVALRDLHTGPTGSSSADDGRGQLLGASLDAHVPTLPAIPADTQ